MKTLLLRLAAPLQSWGNSEGYNHRFTGPFPTKSGIVGMLAAAEGRKRTDSIEDLSSLNIAIRIDQPGTVMTDFQVIHFAEGMYSNSRSGDKDNTLLHKGYLQDAVFLAGIESENEEVLKNLEWALNHPVFPLYLGRKSCPPSYPLILGIRDGDAGSVLRTEPLRSDDWYNCKTRSFRRKVHLLEECLPDEGSVIVNDDPVSFDSNWRRYQSRDLKDTVIVAATESFLAKMKEKSSSDQKNSDQELQKNRESIKKKRSKPYKKTSHDPVAWLMQRKEDK